MCVCVCVCKYIYIYIYIYIYLKYNSGFSNFNFIKKAARYSTFAHDVPTRAHLHFSLNCQPNEEITKTDVCI